jgi:RimJ/RimL family protein N-acetyltransferase
MNRSNPSVSEALFGAAVPNWTARKFPEATRLVGRHVRLEQLDPAIHSADLYAAFTAAPDDSDWDYLPYGPFHDPTAFTAWLGSIAVTSDPQFYSLINPITARAVGVASYMRIDPPNGSIEIGGIHFSRALQRTPAATEALVLMMARAFDELGYRRLEWKCNALNARSRRAAVRLGFTYEGTFRQAVVVKGRNRDTAWFSMLDSEWPARKSAFAAWLDPANFDAMGAQRQVMLHPPKV